MNNSIFLELAGMQWVKFIFDNLIFRSILAGFTSLLVVSIAIPILIKTIKKFGWGESIRDKKLIKGLYDKHRQKAGTPSMGGIAILLGTVLSTILFIDLSNVFIITTLFVILSLGALGLWDDLNKVKGKANRGLKSKTKWFIQLLIAITAISFLQIHPISREFVLDGEIFSFSNLFVPIFGKYAVPLEWLGILLMVLVIVGSSNGVNLTDGLDGLSAGCSLAPIIAFMIIAYFSQNLEVLNGSFNIPKHPQLSELVVLLASLLGACLGFLYYNRYPASIFMGDTGSLAIGGALGMVAICTKQELLLLLIGSVFVIETLSVVLQVTSFKLRGKRIFKMSPIHHHFELVGWSESKVVKRFYLLSFIVGVMGLFLTGI